MSHHEAKYLASFLTTLPLSVVYALTVHDAFATGALLGPDAGAAAGRTILTLIAAIVGVGIVIQALLHIVRLGLGQEVEWHEDERDKLIELKAVNIAFSVFGAGFLAALIGLWRGLPPTLVIHLITGAMLVAGLTGDAMRLWFYRKWG